MARLSYQAESEKEAQAMRTLAARKPHWLEEAYGQEELHLHENSKPEWAELCGVGHGMPYYFPKLERLVVRLYWGIKYWANTPRVHITVIAGTGGRIAMEWDPIRHREGLFFPDRPLVLTSHEPAALSVVKKSNEPFRGRIVVCYIQGKQID